MDYTRPHVTVPTIFLVLFVIFPTVHACLWALERRSRQLAKRRFERQDAEAAAAVAAGYGVEEVKEEQEWATRLPGQAGESLGLPVLR